MVFFGNINLQGGNLIKLNKMTDRVYGHIVLVKKVSKL